MLFTEHAFERFQEKHPSANHEMMQEYFESGLEITPQMAGTLTVSNKRRTTRGTNYMLAPDYSGLFVCSDGIVITFLRFGIQQQRVCENLWGNVQTEEEPTPAVLVVPPPPVHVQQHKADPNSLRVFREWLRENLHVKGPVSFPPGMSLEEKRSLAAYMRGSPVVNVDPYEWEWGKAKLLWRCNCYHVEIK